MEVTAMAVKNTQEQLLRAATDLFYRKGYSDTSIREIGVKAGVSNSLLYHYFKDKEEMLFQIIAANSQGLLETLEEIDRKVPEPMERLREMLVQHTIFYGLKNKRESKIVVEDNYWLKGKRKETVKRYQRKIYAIYMNTLKELAQTNRMNDVDLTVLNFSIFGIINWFFRWYKDGGKLSPEAIADNILRLIFHGIIKT
jgi:TetR/AcrR family transcriptional regulator, cholesterol catabolism regulator